MDQPTPSQEAAQLPAKQASSPVTVTTKAPQPTNLSKLPAELRLKIWKYVDEPSSSIVRLQFVEPSKITCSPSLPVSLRINHEARNEFIRQMTRTSSSLGEYPPRQHYFFSKQNIVLIDTLSLGKIAFAFFIWQVRNYLGEEGLSQIRTLAIEDTLWNGLSRVDAKPPQWADLILKLDKFIIFNNGEEISGQNFELVECAPTDSVLRLKRQVLQEFQKMVPVDGSSSSSDEYHIPEVSVMEARKKSPASERLPALPSQTRWELQALEDFELLTV